MQKENVVKQCKKIQSQLGRDKVHKPDGSKFTLEDTREAIALHCGEYDSEMELTDEICDAVIESIKQTQPAPLANRDEAPLAKSAKSDLSVKEQNKIINAVAKEIDVSLPVEALKDIALSVDWALSSRLELMQQLRGQIQLWANHKLQEVEEVSNAIRQETSQLFAEVSTQIHDTIEADNETFSLQAQKMKEQVETSVEKFRDSHTEILSIFALPAKPA